LLRCVAREHTHLRRGHAGASARHRHRSSTTHTLDLPHSQGSRPRLPCGLHHQGPQGPESWRERGLARRDEEKRCGQTRASPSPKPSALRSCVQPAIHNSTRVPRAVAGRARSAAYGTNLTHLSGCGVASDARISR
jgi:hypothetical protein